MGEMSPLGAMLLRILKAVTLGAAVLLALFLAISIWQGIQIGKQDYGFNAVLALLLVGAIWIHRSMGRELKNPGS
jgi:branched-subunit amino acid transport protein AzlD